MCGGSEKLSSKALSPPASPQSKSSLDKNMSYLSETVETKHSFSPLLELAADNDSEGFKRSICNASDIHEVGVWYCCQRLSKKKVLESMTPFMVAAKYGSVDVVKLILSLTKADVNLSCSSDKSTALHYAASSGSINAVDVIKLLLLAGADPNVTDADGHRPLDVIVAHPNIPHSRVVLEELLKNDVSVCLDDMQVSTVSLRSSSQSLSSSLDTCSLASVSDLPLSFVSCKPDDMHTSSVPEKKEYPIDPSFPDIKDSMYTSDEFRMFSFKIRPCSRAYSHDWTECPFAHPGENARRRDPRKFHYSCVPCPDFRKGACGRGDLCEYAHGVFESWLHPAQYRTRLCKDGISCARPVCFFAHTSEELRPLYVSTGSGVPSPRSAAAMEMGHMASAFNMLPGSPSAVSAMSHSLFSPTMCSANDISQSSMGWPQQSIPTLHLPGSTLQASRLRSSLSARDIPADDLDKLQDFEMQHQKLLNDISYLSQPQFGAQANLSACSKTLTPTNLDKLLCPEVASPRYSDQFSATTVLSPSHRSMALNQFQQQQSMLAPIKTNLFSPKNADHPLLQGSFGVSSPGRNSPRKVEPISPMNSCLSALAHREKLQQQLCSLSSPELRSNLSHDPKSNSVVGSPVHSWSKWESPNVKVDWSVQADELNQLRRSFSFGRNGEEPDVSWVQSRLKETPSKIKEASIVPPSSMAPSVEGSNLNPESESSDHLGAWLEQLQLDQIVA
ncbi:zinc finger CCCH domain-containing protein 56-like [Pistacia vera]|uniref:zinc finger CCCH domain-containing protein 56-like n=1 Tax=Pistacia vera TaxID=55513 RepID=UPI001262D0B4|nr:zinc finger CCCH domain-containing protein 56-like [Pistacia vera]XP_031272016.1 zinc finger CCCH domain-containing protein 56-like [Pistacia vera]XP_031272017.1 zinc finger CCCH domain-containing protein 56-like [Pistacia vera]XP_031272018.1 zinc finger CCCH domain-containing protein 56-like [Pistacia vera]